MSEKTATQSGFWPRLFRRTSNERRQHTEEPRWAPRPHANSSASAATAVGDIPLTPTKTAPPPQQSAHKQRKLQRRPTQTQRTVEQFPAPLDIMHEESGQHYVHAESAHIDAKVRPRHPAGDRGAHAYSARPLGIAPGHEDSLLFWHKHDMRVGQGGELERPREILDAMVDDVLGAAQLRGWLAEPNKGTFNDVLGIAAMHPIILAFLRAFSEQAVVCLGPEHIWLAVMQSLAATMRGHGLGEREQGALDGSGAMKQQQGPLNSPKPGANDIMSDSPTAGAHVDPEESDAAVDLAGLWHVLRESSGVPQSRVSSASGHEVRLFPEEMHGRHTLSSRGAAPLVMAAAAAGHKHNSVDYGRIEIGGRMVSWQPQRRSTNPAWIQEMCRRQAGIRGMMLTGTLQSWSGLCVLARQLKETYSGQFGREVDWWLHRVHLLARDLADYFAAQEESCGEMPAAWRDWLALALFDGHSGAPRGTRLDGWLVALFALDAHGAPVHERHRWWMEWDCVPAGIDLLRASPSADSPMLNVYSGFVGVQQLRHDPPASVAHARAMDARARNHSGTLQGEDLEAAFGLRDGASTLTGSQEQLVVDALTQQDLHPAFTSLDAAPVDSAPPSKATVAPPARAIAPLIGWAIDG